MSRLLVLTYHFPPDGAVGGQRWAGLSKYLARIGWEVHVVTAAEASPDGAPAGVHRHVRSRRRTLNDWYKAATARHRAAATESASPAPSAPPPAPEAPWPRYGSGSPLKRAITAARRVGSMSMVFPDYSRGWILGAARAARELLLDRPFDVVVSSGPPHFAHFAAMLATRGLHVPHVLDMRDPWSVAHERNAPHQDYFVVEGERLLLSGLERLMWARADKIVTNTQEFTAALSKARPDLDVVWFPNGIDLGQMPPRDPAAVERGSLAHVGALYAGRNLTVVLAAMREVLRERPDAARSLKVHVAGPMDARHRDDMMAQLVADGLSEFVVIHGVLPRSQALQLLNRSHVALVLAQRQGMMVPAKIYESVGMGVPTLVITEEESAAFREAQRIGAMTVDGNDVAGMRKILHDMLDGRIPARMDPITPISYEDLAVRMDRLLRDVMAGRPNS